MNVRHAKALQNASLETPTDLGSDAVRDVASALNILLADIFGLYVKTKNSTGTCLVGIFGTTTSCSTSKPRKSSRRPTTSPSGYARSALKPCIQSARSAALSAFSIMTRTMATPLDMLAKLRDDNKQLTANMRETHDLCDEHRDVATASLLENWIDEAERRTSFLFEATRAGEAG
jgi:starvation-inducible DNA-binding protein